MTMIAPIFRAARVDAATTSSSMVSSALDARSKYLKNGARPKCASARRMSAWNSTMIGEDDVGREIANHPVDRLQIEPSRHEEQPDQEAAAERHLHRARAANEQQQLVDQHSHEQRCRRRPTTTRRGGAAARRAEATTPSVFAMILPNLVGDADDGNHLALTAWTRTMCAPASTAAVTAAAVGQSRSAADTSLAKRSRQEALCGMGPRREAGRDR